MVTPQDFGNFQAAELTQSASSSLLEAVGRRMGEGINRRQDAEIIMIMGKGQCWQCKHAPFKRAAWLYKHLKQRHG